MDWNGYFWAMHKSVRNVLSKLKRLLQKRDWFAYLVDLLIVILGITIAYQLNVVQQENETRTTRTRLLQDLQAENAQNINDFRVSAGYYHQLGDQLLRLSVLLENDTVPIDTLNAYIPYAVNWRYYTIAESYLNTYLNASKELGLSQLTADLLKLQSLYRDLGLLWQLPRDYRLHTLDGYFARGIDYRTNKIIDVSLLRQKEFVNRIVFLSYIEREHARVYFEALRQMEKVDSLMQE